MNKLTAVLIVTACLTACTSPSKKQKEITAFVGATIIDGTGRPSITNGVLVIENGKITGIGPKDSISIPSTARLIDLEGKTIMPGIINAHGHIGGTEGLKSAYSGENVIRDLKLNALYGVTTVYSLGGDGNESIEIRNEQDTSVLDRSRLYVAGVVVEGETPEQARTMVDENAAMNVDLIKIRVDDNLGASKKMSPEIYEAVIDQAKKHNLEVNAHIFYLHDAKALLRLGVKFIAHSVRDQTVDAEFIELMKQNNTTYCPTLMREVSTFVYTSTPDFFTDPFFLAHSDTSILQQLRDPARQQMLKDNPGPVIYKGAFEIAKVNLKILSDAGVKIAFGTDTGPPARFQGYFEHLELEQMVNAGLTPMQAIEAATRDAVRDSQKDKLGTLEVGKYADFLILSSNPLDDIKNTRSIESVWIGGNEIVIKK